MRGHQEVVRRHWPEVVGRDPITNGARALVDPPLAFRAQEIARAGESLGAAQLASTHSSLTRDRHARSSNARHSIASSSSTASARTSRRPHHMMLRRWCTFSAISSGPSCRRTGPRAPKSRFSRTRCACRGTARERWRTLQKRCQRVLRSVRSSRRRLRCSEGGCRCRPARGAPWPGRPAFGAAAAHPMHATAARARPPQRPAAPALCVPREGVGADARTPVEAEADRTAWCRGWGSGMGLISRIYIYIYCTYTQERCALWPLRVR